MTDQAFLPEELQASAAILNNAGQAIAGDHRAAGIAMMRRACMTNPYETRYRLNLATHLAYQGKVEESAKLLEGIMLETPQDPNAWNLRAFLATIEGDLQESIACNKVSLQLAPLSGKFKFDLACSYLRAGDFENGWPLYEARTEIDYSPPPPGIPRWDGSRKRHILVYGDQGIGDKIQFARFIPWVREHCDKLTFAVDIPSMPLFHGYRQICDITGGGGWEDCDAAIATSSLPLMYGANAGNLPPDPGLIEVPDVQGAMLGDGLKIGIAWAGNPRQVNNYTRSMPFTEIIALGANARNSLWSLQVGPRAADIAVNEAQLLVNDMSGNMFGNWSAAPAIIKRLDLVVTVCTATAHLAGALGVPTFLMLSRFSCWRWLWDRHDTPWYPSVKIFRQERLHEWKPVVDKVAAAINQIHSKRAAEARMRPIEVRTAPPAAIYEPDLQALMRRVLRPGDTFIDVGANVGKLTVLGAQLVTTQSSKLEVGATVQVMVPDGVFRGLLGIVRGIEPDGSANVLSQDGQKRNFRQGDLIVVAKRGRVIAIEPGENNLPALRAATKDMDGVVEIVPKAAWSVTTELPFYENLDNGDGNAAWNPADWPGPHNPKTKAQNPSAKMVAAIALDDLLLPTLNYARLIKIDTEGAEQHVLEGAQGMLHNASPGWRGGVPYIVAELHEFGLQKLGHSQETLRAYMRAHGYSLFMLYADGTIPLLIPDGTKIETGLIFNLLFSTPEAVAEAWPTISIQATAQTAAPMHAYGSSDPANRSLKPNQPAKPFAAQKPNGLAEKLAEALGSDTAAAPSIKLSAKA